jgi:hypothetical protein
MVTIISRHIPVCLLLKSSVFAEDLDDANIFICLLAVVRFTMELL